jgi:hypothetical protein
MDCGKARTARLPWKCPKHPRKVLGFGPILRAVLYQNRARSVLALALMVARSCLFNTVFFTYGLVLSTFYHITEARTGAYLLPLAAGNLLGRCC